MQTLLEQASEVRVIQYNTPDEAEPLLTLFESITKEQGWKPGSQLRAYPKSAVYFGLEINNSIVGGLQLITGNANEGLPVLTVWPELNLQGRTDVADIALLAMAPNQRGSRKVFSLLCTEMWRYCRENHIYSLWAEVTPARLQLYRRLGWPLQVAGVLRQHWGEACYPCVMTTEAIGQEIAKRATKSPLYQHIFQLMNRP